MTQKPKVLIVDDDEDILDLLKYNLLKEGYEVKTLSSAEQAVSVAVRFRPDLIVLDLIMPDENGIEICRAIRGIATLADVYIFFLTANSDEYFKQAVFSVGGDDFIEKIVGLKPLISRISAVLKGKYIIRKRELAFKAGHLEINRRTQSVRRDGVAITLTNAEFEILFFLAQNSGKYVTVNDLIKNLWGSTMFMDEPSVRRFLGNLKNKLGHMVINHALTDAFRFSA